MTTPAAARLRWTAPRVVLPAALAAVAAAALLLPWWRADRGAVLLDGEGVRALDPDVWTGVEVTGVWTVVVAALAAVSVVVALLTCVGLGRLSTVAAWASAAAGLAGLGAACRALVAWGPSGAAGPWIALVAGLGAVVGALSFGAWDARSGAARARRWILLGAAAALVVVAVLPGGPGPRATGPFVPVAAVGAFPLRSGADGLAAAGDVRPVLADGVPGVVSRAGVVVGVDGRALVLARLDRGAPAPIGVVGDRVVRWISADAVAVTGLHVDSTVDVVVRGVTEAGTLGADGSVWLRTDADPTGTVRRLDVARVAGQQRIAATWLPVVTIQEPEPPVDLRTVLPVRGGGLRNLADAGRLELLTGTAAGIAARPLVGTRCGAAGVASLDRTAADPSGVWFVLTGADGERLAHLDPATGAVVRTVDARPPGTVTALAAPGDGSLLLVTRDADGAALWRLPDAAAALGAPAEPPVTCPAP